MAMLSVICNDCGGMFSLRGWVEKEDLKKILLVQIAVLKMLYRFNNFTSNNWIVL